MVHITKLGVCNAEGRVIYKDLGTRLKNISSLILNTQPKLQSIIHCPYFHTTNQNSTRFRYKSLISYNLDTKKPLQNQRKHHFTIRVEAPFLIPDKHLSLHEIYKPHPIISETAKMCWMEVKECHVDHDCLFRDEQGRFQIKWYWVGTYEIVRCSPAVTSETTCDPLEEPVLFPASWGSFMSCSKCHGQGVGIQRCQ